MKRFSMKLWAAAAAILLFQSVGCRKLPVAQEAAVSQSGGLPSLYEQVRLYGEDLRQKGGNTLQGRYAASLLQRLQPQQGQLTTMRADGLNQTLLDLAPPADLQPRKGYSHVYQKLALVVEKGIAMEGRVATLYTNQPKAGAEKNYAAILARQPGSYTGQVMYHEISGTYQSICTYEAGRLTHVASLIPRPRAANAVATAAFSNCTDWYLLTTIHYSNGTSYTNEEYVGTTCTGCTPVGTAQGQATTELEIDCDGTHGGGGGGSGADSAQTVRDICKKSFEFKKMINTDNGIGGWQVSGVKNVRMNIVDVTTGELVIIRLPPVYFGLPVVRSNGDPYSTDKAADIAASCVKAAEEAVMRKYHSNPAAAMDWAGMSLYFRQKINEAMQDYAGTASLSSNGFNVTLTEAEYSGFLGLGCLF